MSKMIFALWYGLGNVTPEFSSDLVEKDFRLFRDLGFRYVRIWVNWRDFEPRPGEFDTDRSRVLMESAERYGLGVIAQVYLEFAPDWLPRLYPDSLYTDETGSRLYPQGSPGVCLDHPQARKKAEDFLIRLARELVKYSNFYAWDVWSEPQIIQWVFRLGRPRPMYCYCPYTIKRFREWLRNKYGDIEKLNKSWHRDYGSFDEVEPPRFVVLHFGKENIDWIEFLINKLKEDLRWRVEIIKSIDKNHPVTSHAATTSIFLNPLYGNPDDWEMAEAVDIWGTSLYPKHAHRSIDNVIDAFILDAIRSSSYSAGKDYWVGELQGGHGIGGLKINEPVEPEDIRIWIWQSIAHGAKGINIYHSYPMMWGYETSGYGLFEPSGSPTPRALVAAEQAKIISEYGDLLTKLKPLSSEVALLYNIYIYRLLWVLQETSADKVFKSLLGLYRILYKYNVSADFIHVKQVERGDLDKYKILLAPFSISISRAMADRLRDFVSRGGVLLVDARFGWFREDGWLDEEIPAYGMSEIVGASEESCRSIDKIIFRVSENFLGVRKGITVSGALYEEILRPRGNASVIGVSSNEKPIAVFSKYGKGSVLFIGTSIGLAYEEFRDDSIEKLVMGLVNYADVSRPLVVAPATSNVEIRVLASEGSSKEMLVIVLNHDRVARNIELIFDQRFSVSRIRDLMTNKTYEVKEGRLRLDLSPKAVIVGYVER